MPSAPGAEHQISGPKRGFVSATSVNHLARDAVSQPPLIVVYTYTYVYIYVYICTCCGSDGLVGAEGFGMVWVHEGCNTRTGLVSRGVLQVCDSVAAEAGEQDAWSCHGSVWFDGRWVGFEMQHQVGWEGGAGGGV